MLEKICKNCHVRDNHSEKKWLPCSSDPGTVISKFYIYAFPDPSSLGRLRFHRARLLGLRYFLTASSSSTTRALAITVSLHRTPEFTSLCQSKNSLCMSSVPLNFRRFLGHECCFLPIPHCYLRFFRSPLILVSGEFMP